MSVLKLSKILQFNYISAYFYVPVSLKSMPWLQTSSNVVIVPLPQTYLPPKLTSLQPKS